MPHMAVYLLVILVPFFVLFLLRAGARAKPSPNLPPGPRPLPVIGNLHILGRLPHRALADLAHKHGPIMSLRLGHVPAIVASSPEAAELFLKQHDAAFASRPTLQAVIHMSYGGKGIGFAPYGEFWRGVRRMCSMHLLSPAKVASFEGLRRAEIEAAIRGLREAAEAREVVDVGERVGELIEQIMFKMVVGKEAGKRYDLKGVIAQAVAAAGAFNVADFVPFLAPLDLQGLNRKSKAIGKSTNEVAENIIDVHMKEKDFGEHKDIVGTMLDLMENPNNEFFSSFERNDVKTIMLDLFVAGIDTSLVTITWALSALIKHPRVMKLLQEELDATVGRKRMVLESDLTKLPFLDMVVKETFRLYPAAPLLVPHESMEDVVVNGYTIPKKSRLIVNFWAIGRDPRIWTENAEEFYPERFMSKDIDVRGRNFELIPFGAGRRGCPGLHLGLVMVKLVLVQLVHCFNWELPNGMRPEEVDMAEKFGLTMPRANKLLAIPFYRLIDI